LKALCEALCHSLTQCDIYYRCLLTGSSHDLPVIFKLSRMWFSLGGDKDIVDEMAAAAYEVPSYKFLPLAYQLASRLSRAGRNRALDDSGFSVRPTCALGIMEACTRARRAASVVRRCIIIGKHAIAFLMIVMARTPLQVSIQTPCNAM